MHDFNAELHVVHVNSKSEFKSEPAFETVLLQEMLDSLKPEYHLITDTHTDDSILEFAENNHIDLLIVVPKREGLLKKIVHKSHARQFVLYSHVPVMTLHE